MLSFLKHLRRTNPTGLTQMARSIQPKRTVFHSSYFGIQGFSTPEGFEDACLPTPDIKPTPAQPEYKHEPSDHIKKYLRDYHPQVRNFEVMSERFEKAFQALHEHPTQFNLEKHREAELALYNAKKTYQEFIKDEQAAKLSSPKP